MRCIAKQNDEAFARIHLEFIGIEMIAQAEVETQDMIEQTRSSRCLCGIILTRWVL